MRRTILSALVLSLVLAVLLIAAPGMARAGEGWHGGRGHGHGHGHGHWGGGPRVVVGVGPGYGWGVPWGYGYGYGVGYGYGYWRAPWVVAPPLYYPGYAPPARVYEPEPTVYVQRPAPPAREEAWYWCASAQGYYPDVATCPEDWIPVAPR
jgi:hypothetical protein